MDVGEFRLTLAGGMAIAISNPIRSQEVFTRLGDEIVPAKVLSFRRVQLGPLIKDDVIPHHGFEDIESPDLS
jgi:hypothetical protein